MTIHIDSRDILKDTSVSRIIGVELKMLHDGIVTELEMFKCSIIVPNMRDVHRYGYNNIMFPITIHTDKGDWNHQGYGWQ